MTINGYAIDGRDMPSDVFYNRHKEREGTLSKVSITRQEEIGEPTIAELEADQKELYALYKSGEMRSEDYQREWQQLEDQIKAIRQEREQRGRYEQSLPNNDSWA